MRTNRRSFLKTAAAGLAAIGLSDFKAFANGPVSIPVPARTGKSVMGLKTEPLSKVRIGLIGLGMRGADTLERLMEVDGVEITAICDVMPDRVEKCKKVVKDKGRKEPAGYSNGDSDWMNLCKRDDVDLVYSCTPWYLHTPASVYAMKQGKHAATEVPAATTLEDCWDLVNTSEATQRHCMMLENCCYDFFELATLNMARQGVFGEIMHTECAYDHDLRWLKFDKEKGYYNMWRLQYAKNHTGNLYPTHGLGPVCQIMNINRGDRMEYLTSMSSIDFTMGKHANALAAGDPFFAPYANKNYRGNMNTSLVRTNLGRTILIQHDVSSVHPYSRLHVINGTSGSAMKYPGPERIALGEDWLNEEELKAVTEKFTPEIVKRVGEMAKKVGGHGGMDFIMDWRLIDCLRNGLPLDQDVYDGALWSSIAPLSEWSVANRSQSIDVPDFTGGAWKSNTPHDINLEKGGNTQVLEVVEAKEEMQLNVK